MHTYLVRRRLFVESDLWGYDILAAAAAKSHQSCNSVWPHRRQPTRLPHPWDSPGKNTGVGFHFLLQCVKVKSESEVAQSSPTLCDPMDCSLPGSSIHGIFQARVLEWGAIAFSNDILRGEEKGFVSLTWESETFAASLLDFGDYMSPARQNNRLRVEYQRSLPLSHFPQVFPGSIANSGW